MRIVVQPSIDGGFAAHAEKPSVEPSVGYRMDTIEDAVGRLLEVRTRIPDCDVFFLSPGKTDRKIARIIGGEMVSE